MRGRKDERKEGRKRKKEEKERKKEREKEKKGRKYSHSTPALFPGYLLLAGSLVATILPCRFSTALGWKAEMKQRIPVNIPYAPKL